MLILQYAHQSTSHIPDFWMQHFLHTSHHTSSSPSPTHRQPSAVIVHEKWALDHCHACIHNVVEEQQGEGPQANLVVDTPASPSEYTTVRVR